MITTKTYIVGNWKMNLSHQEAMDLMHNLQANYQPQPNCEVVIAPQFPMLFSLSQTLKTSPIKISAQNCASELTGAYTGEVSANALLGLCDYCIIGHSERRNIFQESPQNVAKKFFLLQDLGIIPIFCIGESLQQRASGMLESTLIAQLEPILHTKNTNFIIAYEPVWAIGTGKIATSEQIASIHLFLSNLLAKKQHSTPILYGGSVKAANSQELLQINNLHGLLVGGASLKATEFLEIIKTHKNNNE